MIKPRNIKKSDEVALSTLKEEKIETYMVYG